MLIDNLFSGVVDFTDGSLSSIVGITGSATYGSSVVTGVDVTILPGLTSGLPVTALPSGILDPGTTILSIGADSIELSNGVGYTGSANFYVGLTSGNYILNNALFVDVNNIYTVNDIPDYEIGASGGLGISPFAIYTQGRYNNQKNLKAIYEKYIITKVLSRNNITNRFSAIVTWGFPEPAPSSVNTGQTVLPIVQLSPLNLLPPIIDYRAFTYKNLPEGQPFNQEILQVLDFGGSGGQGVGAVYSQFEQIVGGTTGIPFANSFNFIDGPEDQVEQIDAYIDPTSPPGVGNVIVAVKAPGRQSSTIGIQATRTISETANIVTMTITRSLSGEADKLVPSLVKVNYSYQDGTAVNGSDYSGTNGSVSFIPTSTGTLTFTFQVFDNIIQEGPRFFNINYSVDPSSTGKAIFAYNSGATGATGTTLVTITDNDTPSSYNFNFSPASASQYEPKDGPAGTLGGFYPVPTRFNLSSSGTIQADQGTVTLNLLGTGTAVRGTDYVIYYNNALDSSNNSWNLTFTGNQPNIPVVIVPIRNPNRYDTNTTINFNLTSPGATSNSQPSVVFPASIGTPGTYTFTILEADISTISTFKFSNASYANVPEGATGQMVIQRVISNYNNYPAGNDANVNYVEATNSSISLNFDPTSSAVKGTDFSPIWYIYDVQTGGSPVQTLNYTSVNSNTVNFASGEFNKYVRIGTVSDGVPSQTRTVKSNLSNPNAVVNGVNRGATGSPKDTTFNITDNSAWAISTFTVSASPSTIQQPTSANATVTLSINRSLNTSSGVIPDPIEISYTIESTGGANGAVYGVHYSTTFPQQAVVNFDANTNSYQIPVTIIADPQQILDGNRSFKITIFQPSYTNPATPTNLAVLGNPSTVTVTINDTYQPPPYNRTFYYFHGGGGSNMPNQNNMVDPTATYKLATGGTFYYTSDLSEVMTALIGQTSPAYKFPINSFTLPYGQAIPGSNAQWTYATYTSPDSFYLAVPKNSPPLSQYYSQDLASSVAPYYLANAANSTANYATGGKEFTYNGEVYKLYKLGENPTTASVTYKFV
jgi:hypothetical protein